MEEHEAPRFVLRLKFKDSAEGIQTEKTKVFSEPSMAENTAVREWLIASISSYINISHNFRTGHNNEVFSMVREISEAARKTKTDERLKEGTNAEADTGPFYERSLYSKKGNLIITASIENIKGDI